MSPSKINQARQSLYKLVEYVLARRPDEFGLAPEGGTYRLKEVIKALAEEGRPVRESQFKEINALALADGQPQPLIIEEGRINLSGLEAPEPLWEDSPPVLLYGFCRRRAQAHVLERGLSGAEGRPATLCRDEEMARRLGQRIDPDPIIITVEAARAVKQGVALFRVGELIFLSDPLGPHLLHLPPLPKEKEGRDKKPKKKDRLGSDPIFGDQADGPRMPSPDAMPGSFFMTSDPEAKAREKRERVKAKKKWQQERRDRRQKKD